MRALYRPSLDAVLEQLPMIVYILQRVGTGSIFAVECWSHVRASMACACTGSTHRCHSQYVPLPSLMT